MEQNEIKGGSWLAVAILLCMTIPSHSWVRFSVTP